ncbi:GntR family transcriptional regulator [Halomonas denitrificans]|uniref:GntR family transcriptional regulator n=1 Tax=Halomonas TaxID=2745 RepID=UPI001A908BE0|nr:MULTISPECIES: GntR family transcriptional regulator [Halomonas]MED5296220.1 GntR family transcriptional regulator [Pseudomonadota bacterium]MBN8410635.1 GntR family transcriptional regulator [Halomonas litopenaei]MBY5925727.1 GntR family transcriptional regulator [Halomonas sp. DP4Y7-2]MBY5930714.1 GntR family transcriptional regulator [Halomonas sp. DP8Y7-3]MBY5969234.1 GntR family transcriptional regulator [Halomonas denitrificans]
MSRSSVQDADDLETRPSAASVAEEIVGSVEEDIVLGRLHPKERLVEEDLIERFDCKRHVVRQALFQLEDIGLVERIRNRGAFVKAYTPEEVEHLYAMREILELAGVDALPLPAPSSWLDELSELHQRYSAAVDAQDLRRVFHLNIAFHRALFAATGNPYLADTINEFAQKAHGIRFIAIADSDSLSRARHEHQAMIDAIRHQDRDALRELCRQHLLPSKNRYLQLHPTRR